MIALDSALGLVEIEGVRATRDLKEVGDYTPDVQSWIAVNPDSELIPVARANGVAYVQPAPQGGVVAGQSALVVLDGWTAEQMAVRKPVALHVYWPGMDLNTTPKEQSRDKAKWKSLPDQNKGRREKLKALEDFFEEARAYAKACEAAKNGAPDPDRNPPWEAVLPVMRGERKTRPQLEHRRLAISWPWKRPFSMKISLVCMPATITPDTFSPAVSRAV